MDKTALVPLVKGECLRMTLNVILQKTEKVLGGKSISGYVLQFRYKGEEHIGVIFGLYSSEGLFGTCDDTLKIIEMDGDLHTYKLDPKIQFYSILILIWT